MQRYVRDKVLKLASKHGWVAVGGSQSVQHFRRGGCTLTYSIKGRVVKTTMVHPVRGPRSLVRKGMDLQGLEEVLCNPRAHTWKGQYVRFEP